MSVELTHADRAEMRRFVAWRPPREEPRRYRINPEHVPFINAWRERRQLLEAAWLRAGRRP